jgi:hypothetical protein
MSSRISNHARDVSYIMSPEELRALREKAQARKAEPSSTDRAP